LLAALLGNVESAMALDLTALWDFGQPALSHQRLEAALAQARGDDALILQTQMARTWGLRRDFEKARAVLAPLEHQLASAGPEARARHALEWGRTWASAAHPSPVAPEALATARASFEQALALARGAALDALAIDAIHMMAFVETPSDRQLHWAREALAVVLVSTQPDARRWEPSIRNNLGYALHQLGRLDEALAQFEQAVKLRQALPATPANAENTRIAWWMVAWTLRGLGRTPEALAILLRLEREADAAGQPDPEVFDELQTLYRGLGDEARAAFYAQRKKAAAGG
jgi:tetratricopeptide (TPR) repeat protein